VRVIPIMKHFQKFIFLFSSHDTQQVPTWYHENSFLIKKEKRKMLTRAAVSLFKNARALPEEKFWWIRCPAYIH
jgi:ribosomal protein L9